jgi:isopenicillin N synthase-like dioxygenase
LAVIDIAQHTKTAAGASSEVSPVIEESARNFLNRSVPTLVTVPRLSQNAIQECVAGLDRLLASHTKRGLRQWNIFIPRDPRYRETDDGLIRKEKTDHKHYLHYRHDLERLLWTKRSIRLSPGERMWFSAMRDVHVACTEALYALARAMDDLRPGFDFENRARAHGHLHALRVMRYDAGYESMARAHTDRSALSLHVAESEPGLEIPEGWDSRVCRSPGGKQVLAFPSQDMASITRGALPALWHQVTDQSRTKRSRWVIVFFGKMKRDGDMF